MQRRYAHMIRGMLIALMSVFVVLQQTEAATTITVTTTADELTKNGNCSLREAVHAANTNKKVDACPAGSKSSTDTITLKDQPHQLSQDLNITSAMRIQASGTGALVKSSGVDRGFEVKPGATLTLIGLTMQGGQADLGGGIHNTGTTILDRSMLTRNQTKHGGGVYNTGHLTVRNTFITSNVASESGGGIYNNGGMVVLQSATINANYADNDRNGTGNGGGIANLGGTITLANTILTNTDTGGQAPDCIGTLAKVVYSIIHSQAGCTITSSKHLQITDPQMSLIIHNDGPPPHPNPDSPAIDAGSPEKPNSSATACPNVDSRGLPRPVDGNADGVKRCDIGGFERQLVGID